MNIGNINQERSRENSPSTIDADSNSDVSSISRTSSRATSKRPSYVSKESISQLGSTNQLGVPKRPFSKSASESR